LDSSRVLIVDDDDLICVSLGKGLERHGYSVMVAESSIEAISALENEVFDYVVADLVMQGTDGLRVLERSKQLRPSTAVIILTAFADLSSALEALRLGADDFLSKPCNAEQLSLRFQRCTDKLRPFSELSMAVARKDSLLRETHHRVKNDFMMLSALVGLQLTRVNDGADRIRFDELRTKIQTMALVHEEMFHERSYQDIMARPYLAELSRRTVHSFNPNRSPVSVHVEAPDVMLPTETAVPLGVLLTELLTNCMKHAFDSSVGGHIDVMLTTDGRSYSLVVRDNGRGLPSDFRIDESETLGMKIVSGLASQLRGTVEYRTAGGASFSLKFSGATL